MPVAADIWVCENENVRIIIRWNVKSGMVQETWDKFPRLHKQFVTRTPGCTYEQAQAQADIVEREVYGVM
jgi:hypothetical protein